MKKIPFELRSARKNRLQVKSDDTSGFKKKTLKRRNSKENLNKSTEYYATIKCSHGFFHPVRKGTNIEELLKLPLKTQFIEENIHIEWSVAKTLLRIQQAILPCHIRCCDNAEKHKSMRQLEVSEMVLNNITETLEKLIIEINPMLKVLTIQSNLLMGVISKMDSLSSAIDLSLPFENIIEQFNDNLCTLQGE